MPSSKRTASGRRLWPASAAKGSSQPAADVALEEATATPAPRAALSREPGVAQPRLCPFQRGSLEAAKGPKAASRARRWVRRIRAGDAHKGAAYSARRDDKERGRSPVAGQLVPITRCVFRAASPHVRALRREKSADLGRNLRITCRLVQQTPARLSRLGNKRLSMHCTFEESTITD